MSLIVLNMTIYTHNQSFILKNESIQYEVSVISTKHPDMKILPQVSINSIKIRILKLKEHVH
jgi:hypothetical protein